MDKNVHLTDKNERTRKIYRVKMMPGKQRHLKAKEEQSSFSASQPLSSKLPEDKKHNTQMQFSTYQKKAAEIAKKYEDIADILYEMEQLAKILREKRHRDGNIDFDVPEAKIYLDENKYPIEIKKTSSPNVKDAKHFGTLSTFFPSLEVSEGGIICNAEDLLPLGQNLKIIPFRFI